MLGGNQAGRRSAYGKKKGAKNGKSYLIVSGCDVGRVRGPGLADTQETNNRCTAITVTSQHCYCRPVIADETKRNEPILLWSCACRRWARNSDTAAGAGSARNPGKARWSSPHPHSPTNTCTDRNETICVPRQNLLPQRRARRPQARAGPEYVRPSHTR